VTNVWSPQFSAGRGISSQAAEFSLCLAILIFLQNFARIENSPIISMTLTWWRIFIMEKIILNC